MTAYGKLEEKFATLMALHEAEGFLHWDAATMMPPGSHGPRSEQVAALKAVCHAMITDPETADLLDRAADQTDLDPWAAANLSGMRRMWVHATALDADLVQALSKASMGCETVWRKARPEGDFKLVLPHLTEVVNLTKQAAQAKAEKFDCDPYDALMDQFTPGLRRCHIDPVFQKLEGLLPSLLERILDRQAENPPPIMPDGPFPIDQQRALGVAFMEILGFDFDHGRLDISLHPFSGGTPDDLRITTRYDEDDFTTALMGILHETGHALYEKGLPKAWRLQPVGGARGMDIHESQSLLIEMQVCRSREFLQFAAPYIQKAFAQTGPAWSPENLYRIYTRVDRGLIRVDADEVTYPLHIILRYNLETALLSGDLAVQDLPAAWNDAMDRLLGIRPDNDGDGCMQDIHWFDGAIGYFPSYTLGALTAAQFFAAAKRDDDKILAAIAAGDFKPLYAWLGKNIHGLGSLYETPELIRKATGEALNPDIFVRHLQDRYLA